MSQQSSSNSHLYLLTLAALGVVYGDIGTSPLYALRECFFGTHAIQPTTVNVFGVLSLIVWSLVIVISIKYLTFVMRANNAGEGGILALLSLLPHEPGRMRSGVLVALGLFGAALLYGDGMITPAISVLSAVEGLSIVTPVFQSSVVPITIVILIALFALQKRGTGSVGTLFGPVMVVWFITIAALGIRSIVAHPSILLSMNPYYAWTFFAINRLEGILVLGAVFLVVTGGEALYADMGHFGARPIRLAWFVLVLPSLLLNYFGQGALMLADPANAEHPFFLLAPSWAILPMVILSTVAAVIASQAVISGSFSLTRQAVQLGYSPRVEIDYTSAEEIGQIYIPQVNWALMVSTIGLVIGFESSSNLAAAYGVAVTTTMVITTLLAYVVTRTLWGWSRVTAVLVTTFFLTIDLAFFGANILKITHGGWFPLLVAALVFTLMSTWKQGRSIVAERLIARAYPFEHFMKDIVARPPVRVRGTAVFMTGYERGTPPALRHNLEHNKVLHEQVILLSVLTAEVPHVPKDEQVDVIPLGERFFRIKVRYGFMEEPNVPEALGLAKEKGLNISEEDTTYFLGRETLLVTGRPGMAIWRERLFVLMSRNALRATAFFRIPPERVVELGLQVEL